MTLYAIANYLHIVGAMGVVAALCLEWTIVFRLRSAETTELVRLWLGLSAIQRTVGPASLAALLIGGLYMAATRWGGVGWIVVGLAALLLIAALGAYNGIRLVAIGRTLADETGQLSPDARQRLRDPRIVLSINVRVAMVLGVVLIMITKLDLSGSLLTVGTTIGLGLISVLPAWRRQRANGELAHEGA
jgi:hypothetical protein